MISKTHNRRNDTAPIPVHMASWQLALKRFFDFVCALMGLILFSPVFVVIYLALLLQRDGNPIFSQERVGMGGRIFKIYKFRSMHVGAENGTPVLAQKQDARLTPIGKFLRNHHLDELPQLWNVVKGDMSFVGYRPERQFFIDQIMENNPDYKLLYNMRPGLFSMATLYNGYTDTMDKMLERLRMDLDYLYNRSLWLDIKIIFLTAVSILTGKKF